MKKFFFLIISLLFSFFVNSQNLDSKWVIGASSSLTIFEDYTLGERFNSQIPKINISRYVFSSFSLDVGLTSSVINKVDGIFSNAFNYFSLDGSVRYDFNLSNENLVPYIGLGASIVGGPETLPSSKTTATLNFLFGGTYWISNHWGLNAQYIYKFSPEEYESMISHTQLTAGLVYSLNPRPLVRRIWDRRR